MMEKHKKIMKLDAISIVLTIIWLLGCGAAIIPQPIDLILLGIPFVLSAIAVFINMRTVRSERVSAYSFGFMSYWHPYCTFAIIIFLFLIVLPGECLAFRIFHIIGMMGVLFVVIWSLFCWIKNKMH